MIITIAALACVAGALIWAQDRRDQRERAERAVLLQRIQAPREAVYEHATRTPAAVATAQPAEVAAVPLDDDLGYWAAAEGVSKEQLADALGRHELAEGLG